MTHTPGPWGVLRGKEIVVVYTPFRGSEDELSSFISLHNGAPDMLEALEGAKWLIECYVAKPEGYEEYQDVVKAIRKARRFHR